MRHVHHLHAGGGSGVGVTSSLAWVAEVALLPHAVNIRVPTGQQGLIHTYMSSDQLLSLFPAP